ncbi:ArsR/SmtB family transcription factor [Williamsia sterculiae]|uniref:Regulatory protein, arsR family n=1 Tax=Williamsia sterculiae TaxID=1344003 RepID=A0A1N7DPM7_9NOCA|nr:metalloregulator ArsR/SmtB family transcription factor [Williamsia sterculiae]SIR77774.1 regulatory protein, arsR family [Williamsia sterculiae]
MLILEDVSAVPEVRVRTLPGVECCLALWAASRGNNEQMSRAAVALREALPSWAQTARQRLDRDLPRWPLALIQTMYRLDSPNPRSLQEALVTQDPELLAEDLALDQSSSSLQPAALADLVRLTIKGFLDAGFADHWNGDLDHIERTNQRLERWVRFNSVRAIASVAARIFFDEDYDRLVVARGSGVEMVSCRDIDGVDIMPTYWVSRTAATAHVPGRIGLAVSCGPDVLDDSVRIERIEQMLRALGSDHGLQIVLLCLERPRTTSELCPLLHVTAAPVSRQLKRLENAGLVHGERSGRFVVYSTTIEACQMLGNDISRLAERINREVAQTMCESLSSAKVASA